MYLVELLVDAAGIPAGTQKTLRNRAVVEDLVSRGFAKLISTEAPFTPKGGESKDSELSELKKEELIAICTELGLEFKPQFKKEQLIALITEHKAATEAVKQDAQVTDAGVEATEEVPVQSETEKTEAEEEQPEGENEKSQEAEDNL